MQIDNILLAGAGAVGLSVASQIFENYTESIAILACGERKARYEREGLFVNEKKIDFNIVDDKDDTPFDLIIIACKYHHLNEVLKELKSHVKKDSIILSLLNGIDSEEKIASVYKTQFIPKAFILGIDAQHYGTKTTYSQKGKIVFGRKDNLNDDSCIKAVCSVFDKAEIPYEIPKDIQKAQWYKFMMNVGLNQVSAVLKETYSAFQTEIGIPYAISLMEDAMKEVLAISKVLNTGLCDDDIIEIRKDLDKISGSSRTSMCQDVLAHRKTEVEMFSEVVIRLGKENNIETPVNEVLYKIIKSLESACEK